MNRRTLMLSAGALALSARAARAAEEVVIGLVYPLTGNGAQVGLDAKVAYELSLIHI